MKLTAKLTEAAFTRQVLEFARLHGWRSAHFRPGRTNRGWRTAVSGDGVGFPDLILVRRGVLVVAELKVGDNTLSVEQGEWLRAFENCPPPVQAFVWFPDDWPEIERVLGGNHV